MKNISFFDTSRVDVSKLNPVKASPNYFERTSKDVSKLSFGNALALFGETSTTPVISPFIGEPQFSSNRAHKNRPKNSPSTDLDSGWKN